MSLGPAEILVVLVLALIVFGPKRLPEVGRQVGGALRELRKVQDTVQHELRSVMDDTIGPVRDMNPLSPNPFPNASANAPPGLSPDEPARPELHGGEPDLGDEQNQLPAPATGAATTPADDPERPGIERPGIDGLSGGSFS